MRALGELIDTNELGWALIEEWLKEAKTTTRFCLATKAGRKASFWGFRSLHARRWARLSTAAAVS